MLILWFSFFIEAARSEIDLAVPSRDRLEFRPFVPTWRKNWSGFSRNNGNSF